MVKASQHLQPRFRLVFIGLFFALIQQNALAQVSRYEVDNIRSARSPMLSQRGGTLAESPYQNRGTGEVRTRAPQVSGYHALSGTSTPLGLSRDNAINEAPTFGAVSGETDFRVSRSQPGAPAFAAPYNQIMPAAGPASPPANVIPASGVKTANTASATAPMPQPSPTAIKTVSEAAPSSHEVGHTREIPVENAPFDPSAPTVATNGSATVPSKAPSPPEIPIPAAQIEVPGSVPVSTPAVAKEIELPAVDLAPRPTSVPSSVPASVPVVVPAVAPKTPNNASATAPAPLLTLPETPKAPKLEKEDGLLSLKDMPTAPATPPMMPAAIMPAAPIKARVNEEKTLLAPTPGANSDTPVAPVPVTPVTPEKNLSTNIPASSTTQPASLPDPTTEVIPDASKSQTDVRPTPPAPVASTVEKDASSEPVKAAVEMVKPQPIARKKSKKAKPLPVKAPTRTAVMGSAQGFEETPDVWDAMPSDGRLSPESRRVLARMPSNLDRKGNGTAPSPFTIDRSNPAITELFPEEGYVTGNPVGISIQVKRPNLDVNYELEKAYNALMAGERTTAIEIYQNVLQNQPNNKLALFGLATTYHRAGQLAQARPIYARLLTIDPMNREALNNFLALVGEEAPEDALQQLRSLQTRNPDFSPIPAQMAVIYDRIGRHEQAAYAMRDAVNISPENMTYRYNLAIMLDKMGNSAAAAKAYRDVLAAHDRGETIPGSAAKIQERLTIIGSNAP